MSIVSCAIQCSLSSKVEKKSTENPIKREWKSVLIGCTVFRGPAVLLSRKAGVTTQATNPPCRGLKQWGREQPPGLGGYITIRLQALKTQGSQSVSFAA